MAIRNSGQYKLQRSNVGSKKELLKGGTEEYASRVST